MSKAHYGKDYIEFKKLWDSEIMAKLLRCSKDLGFYNKLRKALSDGTSRFNERHFFEIYNEVRKTLKEDESSIITFKGCKYKFEINRTYTTDYALKSKRHMAQIVVLAILFQCDIPHFLKQDSFVRMDKEIFKHHKISSYFGEKLSFLHLILKLN